MRHYLYNINLIMSANIRLGQKKKLDQIEALKVLWILLFFHAMIFGCWFECPQRFSESKLIEIQNEYTKWCSRLVPGWSAGMGIYIIISDDYTSKCNAASTVYNLLRLLIKLGQCGKFNVGDLLIWDVRMCVLISIFIIIH